MVEAGMGSTRRRFLTYGLGGVVLLAVPTLGLGLRRTVLIEPGHPLQTFNQRQYSVLCAVADTFCPGGGGLPTASEVAVPEQLDALYARTHPGVGKDLAAALDLLENALASALLDQRVQTFTACSPSTRATVLEQWRTSGILTRRAIYKAVRGFVMAAYWGDRRTWTHLDYAGMPDYSRVPSPPPFDEWIASVDAADTPAEESR
jgi:hypothetical protein